MSKLLKYLVIHCAATRPHFTVTRETLEQWHKGPLDVKDSKGNFIHVIYLGKVYKSRASLPADEIGGLPVKDLHGRGWDRLGYSDMITRQGEIINLTPYDSDKYVDYDEVTWGVAGINSQARHVMLEGGLKKDGSGGIFPFLDIFTHAQFVMMVGYCKQFLKDNPGTFLTGHYVFTSEKTCPNFDIVEELHKNAGIPAKYIYT